MMGNGCSKVLYIATDRPYKNSKPKPRSSQKDEECLLARGACLPRLSSLLDKLICSQSFNFMRSNTCEFTLGFSYFKMTTWFFVQVILDTAGNLPLDIEEDHAISVLNRRQHEHTMHSTWIIPSLCKRDNFFY